VYEEAITFFIALVAIYLRLEAKRRTQTKRVSPVL
jgi:hypothetical protein